MKRAEGHSRRMGQKKKGKGSLVRAQNSRCGIWEGGGAGLDSDWGVRGMGGKQTDSATCQKKDAEN